MWPMLVSALGGVVIGAVWGARSQRVLRAIEADHERALREACCAGEKEARAELAQLRERNRRLEELVGGLGGSLVDLDGGDRGGVEREGVEMREPPSA